MANLRILLAGATGYIGRHVAQELLRRGHAVVALVRAPDAAERPDAELTRTALRDTDARAVDVTDRAALLDSLAGERFDAAVSCLASRSGVAGDAWAIDARANSNVLAAARRGGVDRFVLLSAICVQRPRLAFQHAKLAFERELIESGVDYSIVRPTAFFKSLAGQIERVKRGKPFMLFGDGTATACKPISERDLARYLADCLEDPQRRNAVLPIGGPGAAITPLQQGALLFELLGRTPRFRRVPVAVFDAALTVLVPLSKLLPRLEDKAELARIGRYYATESMLLWNEKAQDYDAEATPSYGEDTLAEFYRRVAAAGLEGQSLGKQRLF